MTESIVVQAALILTLCLLPAAAQDAAKTPDANFSSTQPAVAPPAAAQTGDAKRGASKAPPKVRAKPQSQSRKAYSLFDYQKEIGLSEAQIAQIKDVVKGLQEKLAGQKKTVEDDNAEIHQLLQTNADIKQVRVKLQELANLEVDRQVGDIEASRSVAKIMTFEQQEKWHAIQARLNAPAR